MPFAPPIEFVVLLTPIVFKCCHEHLQFCKKQPGIAESVFFLPLVSHATGLAQFNEFARNAKGLAGQFRQVVVSAQNQPTQQSVGRFVIVRPGKFRWDYRQPYTQWLGSDGKKFWSFDPDLKQVVFKRHDVALSSTPAGLLAGEDVSRFFKLSDDGVSNDGLEWVKAVPLNAEAGFQWIRLAFRQGLPAQMEIQDDFHLTRLEFIQAVLNPPIDAAQFSFTPPPGVDVIRDQ